MKDLHLVVLCLVMLLQSCSKDIDIFTPNNPVQTQQVRDSLALLQFDDLARPEALIVSYDVSEAREIKTSELLTIQIPEDAFVFQDQSLVSGIVQIELLPVLDPSRMLLRGISCLADGLPLHICGMVEVIASQEGKVLALATGKRINIVTPVGTVANGMEVFLGTGSGNHVNWELANVLHPGDEFPITETELYDPQEAAWKMALQFGTPQTGWIACGEVVPANSGNTELCVELPEAFVGGNTNVYVVFQSFNSVVKLEWNGTHFCNPALPTGEALELLMVGVKDGNHYYDRISMELNDSVQFEMLDPAVYAVEDIIYLLSSF